MAAAIEDQLPCGERWRGAASCDPTVHLTIKASTKKPVRQRLARKRRENMRWMEGPDRTVSLKVDETVQVYLSQCEWSAANLRLMHHMIVEGQLPRSSSDDYLAYTVMIHEFTGKYDWQSVLDYDVRYRELQYCC